MRIVRPGFAARLFFPGAVFRIRSDAKVLMLTFDDGPDPASTPRFLDIMGRNNVQALFFCTGKSAENNPFLVDRIKSEGHSIGNHGYVHSDGWKMTFDCFRENIEKAAPHTSGRLFRPPYGHIKPGHFRRLAKDYTIVLWDIMPYDFDSSTGREKSLNTLKKKLRPGSVIVLHDKPGSYAPDFLEEFISWARLNGYGFENPF